MATKGGQKAGAANAWNKKLPSSLQAKPTTGPPPGFSLKTDRAQHRARLLHLSLTLVGQKVILHQTNGAIVEGIFHNFTPFKGLPADQKNVYILKEIIVQEQPSSEPALENGTTLSIPASKVVFVHAVGVASELQEAKTSFGEGPSSKGGFQTDTQISSGTGGRVNDLVAAGNAWTSGGASNNRNQSLEAGRGMNSRAAALAGNKQAAATGDISSGSIGEWDQFKANKELFNVDATFDESLYTTELDTSKIDSKKKKEAERIAKEIQNTTTDNIHMAEERGFKVETDFDEEDLYSGVLTKDGKQRHEKVTITKKPSKEGKSTAQKKTMNYAAAAAKADTTKTKSAPPGFSGSESSTPAAKNDDKKEKKSDGSSSAVVTPEKTGKEEVKTAEPSKDSASAPKDEEKSAEPKKTDKEASKESGDDKKTEAKDKEPEKKAEKKEIKKSKLNANAKSFTFNPSAKSFTPSFGASNPTPPQPAATTDQNMPMYGGVPMQPPHYMQTGPMGQPGMMPMMNPQYPGMRYPVSQMQHQAPQATPSVPSAPSSGNAPTPTPAGSGPSSSASTSNDEQGQQNNEEASQASAGQQQPQRSQQSDQSVHSQGPPQQQMPMQYNVPPNAYFSGGMGMPPRGPGYQFVTGPQQMAGRPGVPPYGMYPMQPGGMPQNMQMRGPNGAPYYPGPNGPMSYPPNAHMYPMMDDGGRGRGGRSSNGGRGGRGRGGRSGRGGRGRSNYNNNGNGGKNYQSQQQPQQNNAPSNKSD